MGKEKKDISHFCKETTFDQIWSCDFFPFFSSYNGLYGDRLRWNAGLSAITEKSLGKIVLWKFQAVSEEFMDKVYRLAWLPPREVPMVDRYKNVHKPFSIYLYPSSKMAFGNSKPSRRNLVTKDLLQAGTDIWAGLPVYRNKLFKVCTDQVYLWKMLVFGIRPICFARYKNSGNLKKTPLYKLKGLLGNTSSLIKPIGRNLRRSL